MLVRNRRQPRTGPEGLSFKTPDEWMVEPAILPEYGGMIFDREQAGEGAPERLLGVGHKLVDMAIGQAAGFEACLAAVAGGKAECPLLACRVYDRVTTGEASRPSVVCGAEVRDGKITIIPDWVLLQKLNGLSAHSLARMGKGETVTSGDLLSKLPEIAAKAVAFVESHGAAFRQPDAEVIAALLPSMSPAGQADDCGST